MSREDFLRFREAVLGSEDLQKELATSAKSRADLIAIAKRLGYVVTAEDIDASAELTDAELDAVSGGIGSFGSSFLRRMDAGREFVK